MEVLAVDGRKNAEQRARSTVAPFRDEYPFEPHFLKLDGHRYHYIDEGPRSAPVVLMVHGNPTWSFYWRHLIRALSKQYRCVAVDHIGCGLSDKPQDYAYTLAQHVANLQTLIDELELAPLTLVAHDWGGPIGLGALQPHAERTRGLVLLNTAAFTGPAPLRIRACRAPLLGPLAVLGLNAFARAATHMAVERPMTPIVRKGFLAPYDTRANRIATLRFVQDIPLAPSHPSWPTMRAIEDSLPQWTAHPVCLIWGARDWCFTTDYLDEFRRRWPHAQVHVADGAGHYVMEDAREDVVAWVQSFLEQQGVSL